MIPTCKRCQAGLPRQWLVSIVSTCLVTTFADCCWTRKTHLFSAQPPAHNQPRLLIVITQQTGAIISMLTLTTSTLVTGLVSKKDQVIIFLAKLVNGVAMNTLLFQLKLSLQMLPQISHQIIQWRAAKFNRLHLTKLTLLKCGQWR
jgi:hypothetical protein